MTMNAGNELFILAHHHLHGSPATAREKISKSFIEDIALTAEIGADPHRHHNHFLLIDAGGKSKPLLEIKGLLDTRPKLHFARTINRDRAAVRLDKAVILHWNAEHILKNLR